MPLPNSLPPRTGLDCSLAGLHAASVVFAKKADCLWCFCQDYHCLNTITSCSVPVEQLPHIDQLMDKTCGSKFITKMDLQAAYHQFQIATGNQWKTAFRVQDSQYEFRLML